MNEVEQLKQDLKEAQLAYQMAAQISQFKTGFLGRIAHELRTPISSIMGLHQLILANLAENPEEEREFIAQAYQATQKLLKIIDEILQISKIEYGRTSLRIIPFQLKMVFADLYKFVHLQAANRNLKLQIILPDSDLYVLADLEKLLQILITLVDTGINLSKEGTIKVVAEVCDKSPTPVGNLFPTPVNQEANLVVILLDFPCSVALWQQDINLKAQISEPTPQALKTLSKQIEISPNLKFLLAQALVESMQGHLKIVEIQPNFTQIQCLIPLSSADSVAPEASMD